MAKFHIIAIKQLLMEVIFQVPLHDIILLNIKFLIHVLEWINSPDM